MSATVLVKLAFLLREETSIGREPTYYGFVPYRYGPFSFALYRELATLERDGYVRRTESRVELNPELCAEVQTQVTLLSDSDHDAVGAVSARYGRISRPNLIRCVYERYPWYARKSELSNLAPGKLPEPPRLPMAAYTAGYEGKSIDEFFDGLLRAGIRALLDVRANPVSRKYGFAKRSIQTISGDLGLDYHHLPELGIASERRANLDDFGSYQRLLDDYERLMLPGRSIHVKRAIRLLRRKPSALFCVERDVRCCHRSRLATRIASESGLEVVHL